MMNVGDRLQEALKLRGMRQADLCRRTGISQELVYLYVHNKSEPGAYNLYKICDGIGVSADYLLGLKGSDKVAKNRIMGARKDRKKTGKRGDTHRDSGSTAECSASRTDVQDSDGA